MDKHLPQLADAFRYYHDGERKDLIHLNKLGLTEIYTYLTDNNCLI
jgi:hypothetical protein